MKSALALILLIALTLAARGDAARVWLCIGSKENQDAVKPLADFRARQGYKVVLSAEAPAAAIKSCQPKPTAILLLGDDNWHADGKSGTAQFPAARRPFYKWEERQPDEFASDMALGDLDADGVPEIPVGRLPVDDATALKALVKKILAWENRPPSPADLSLPLWTGDPNYGPQYTTMVINFLLAQVNAHAPKWAQMWVVNGDPNSPFCGWPADQESHFQQRCEHGGILSAMIGHGMHDHFWSMGEGDQWIAQTAKSAAQLQRAEPTAPRLIFACSCGHFSHATEDCLAECLLRAPGGPVLVIAASVESHPLTNYYTATALLRELSRPHFTMGDLLVRAQKEARDTTEADKEAMLAMLEGEKLGKKLDVPMLKRDQLLMYNILGDPATSIHLPEPLQVSIEKSGSTWKWKVVPPPGAETLAISLRAPMPKLTYGKPAGDQESANAALRQANEALAFKPMGERTASVAWEGSTDLPGTLRLVATGDGKIWAAGILLK